ncbi:MAG TPA: hypothetical protein VMD53_06675 [Rhizomicrobium sp.]|nr:hypothetical protein [Rhizomicrobium sp.]
MNSGRDRAQPVSRRMLFVLDAAAYEQKIAQAHARQDPKPNGEQQHCGRRADDEPLHPCKLAGGGVDPNGGRQLFSRKT